MAKAVIRCWHCKEEIESKDDIEIFAINNRNRKFHKGKNCKDVFIQLKEDEAEAKRRKSEEYKEWDELYQYVKFEILNYRQEMKLSSSMINSMLSLRNGDLILKGNKQRGMGYPFHIILATFKIKKNNILHSLATKNFTTENNKFNYIMAIIRNSINDVYKAYLNKAKQKAKAQTQIVDIDLDSKTKYIRKTEKDESISSMIDDLW